MQKGVNEISHMDMDTVGIRSSIARNPIRMKLPAATAFYAAVTQEWKPLARAPDEQPAPFTAGRPVALCIASGAHLKRRNIAQQQEDSHHCPAVPLVGSSRTADPELIGESWTRTIPTSYILSDQRIVASHSPSDVAATTRLLVDLLPPSKR